MAIRKVSRRTANPRRASVWRAIAGRVAVAAATAHPKAAATHAQQAHHADKRHDRGQPAGARLTILHVLLLLLRLLLLVLIALHAAEFSSGSSGRSRRGSRSRRSARTIRTTARGRRRGTVGAGGEFGPHRDSVDHGCVGVVQISARLVGRVLLAEVGRHETVEDDLLIAAAVVQHLGADEREAMALQVAGERAALGRVVGVARRHSSAVGRVVRAVTASSGCGRGAGGAITARRRSVGGVSAGGREGRRRGPSAV